MSDWAYALPSLCLCNTQLENIGKFTTALNIIKESTTSILGVRDAVQDLSLAQAAAALSSSELSEKWQIAILKLRGISEEEAKAALEAAAAKKADAAATNTATTATSAFGNVLKGLWASNPFLTLAAGAIAVATVIEKLIPQLDDLVDKASESRDAYEQTKSDIESLNSELETTQTRIAELKAQGSLTVTEASELQQLERENALLEAQLKIKQTIAQYEGKAAARDASDVLTKQSFATFGNTPQSVDIIDQTADYVELLNTKTSEYEALLLKHANTEYGSDVWEQEEEQLADYTGYWLPLCEDRISSNMSTIEENYSSLFDDYGNPIAGYEDLIQRVDDLYADIAEASGDVSEQQEKIDSLLSKPTLSDSVDKAVEKAKELNGLSIDEFTSQFGDLSSAAEQAAQEAGEDTDEFVQNVVNTINSMAGAINTDEIKSQIYDALIPDGRTSARGQAARDALGTEINSWLDGLSIDELKIAYGIYESDDTSAWSLEDWQLAVEQGMAAAEEAADEATDSVTELSDALSSLKTEQSALATVMSEANSSTGLTLDSYNALIEAGLTVDSRQGKDAARLHEMLCAWQEQSAKLAAGETTKEDYDQWRYRYPEFDTTQHWEKVPSPALSDMLTEALHEPEQE